MSRRIESIHVGLYRYYASVIYQYLLVELKVNNCDSLTTEVNVLSLIIVSINLRRKHAGPSGTPECYTTNKFYSRCLSRCK